MFKKISWSALGIGSCLLLFATIPLKAHALAGSTSSSSTAPSYVAEWGSSGSGPSQFNWILALATDNKGNVYVVDDLNSMVKKFSSTGTYITEWGGDGTGNGAFDFPVGIAINQTTNDVYVTDSSDNLVQEFTSAGSFIRQWSTPNDGGGFGIAIGPTGNVYVTDVTAGTVNEYTSTGTSVTSWGSYGTGNGQFEDPQGITVDGSGNVFVSDCSTDTIQKFTSSGTFINKWGSNGSGNGQFNFPDQLAVDPEGNVYVADTINHRIDELSNNGTYITHWGTQGSGTGQLGEAFGVAVNGPDIVVADNGNSRVEAFRYLQNLGTVVATNNASDISVSLPTSNDISSLSTEANPTIDTGYTYPLGLVDYTFSTTPGATVPVTLTFQTNLSPSQVAARKYNASTSQYINIPNATITQTTLNGQPALQLSYNVTDGGPLDEDGAANGTIVDPVGVGGDYSTTSTSAPDTGYGAPGSSRLLGSAASIVGAIMAIGAGLVLRYRSKRTTASK